MSDREARLAELLHEGLNLCVRARNLDAQQRRQDTLAASSDPEGWQADGTFDRYVECHNITQPDRPIATKSATLHVWVIDQYERDLADWERRARREMAQ